MDTQLPSCLDQKFSPCANVINRDGLGGISRLISAPSLYDVGDMLVR